MQSLIFFLIDRSVRSAETGLHKAPQLLVLTVSVVSLKQANNNTNAVICQMCENENVSRV